MKREWRVADYLEHILESIRRIEEYVSDMDEITFLSNKSVQDAVIRNIEIIGEASGNIQRVNPEFALQNNEIPWQVMYAMRNRVSHGYDRVDFEIVWKTICNDLPELYRHVSKLASQLKPAD